MISSGLCLFCFIVSCFDYSKLLTRFGPVFQAAAITKCVRMLDKLVDELAKGKKLENILR